MATADKVLLIQLRERTGCGMMDCKKALEETNNDIEKAIEFLRKKGADIATKRSANATAEGTIAAYIHPGNQVGVLLEINCETDFVARTDEFKKFAQDICMHIAALKPLYVSPDQVDPTFLEREKAIIREQIGDTGKPAKVVDQIAEGKLNKVFADICLLQQSFVKNDQLTIEDLVKDMIAKTGERIVIKKFSRFEIGL
jgi:elongation factor Ts